MVPSGRESCPLPDHPVLAEAARALNEAGLWAHVLDRDYRVVYMTDEIRLTNGGLGEMVPVPIGAHILGPEYANAMLSWPGGGWGLEALRAVGAAIGSFALADAPGGREELRALADPRLAAVVDDLSPADGSTATTYTMPSSAMGVEEPFETKHTVLRLREESGRLAGVVTLSMTAVGMSTIGAATAIGDLRHFERMQRVSRAGRRPAAILFADLEGSSALSRRLSTASYFALGRRLTRAADRCVIEADGLVGRHVGDGVVAFFLAEAAGSDSAAARSCIAAARALRGEVAAVAARSELAPDEVVLRFGMHWGTKLYVGNIATGGRSEVTALGDEVNEAARIEACASGGLALASKDLVERLDRDDAAALGLDPDQLTYTPLAELTTATEKARRDAPTIPVCEL